MTYAPANFVVWTEIPVTDMEAGIAFYSAATGADLTLDTTSGPNPMAVFKPKDPKVGVAANLYPGKPAARGEGPTIHLAAAGPLEEAMERVMAAGGEVVSPAIQIPEGRFFYAVDPFGNSISFFEVR
jgi:predicted enzyme related to lactoylglutathione lyase